MFAFRSLLIVFLVLSLSFLASCSNDSGYSKGYDDAQDQARRANNARCDDQYESCINKYNGKLWGKQDCANDCELELRRCYQ